MSFLEIILSAVVLLAVTGLIICCFQHWSGKKSERLEKKRVKDNKKNCPFQTGQEIQFMLPVKRKVDGELEDFIYKMVGKIVDMDYSMKTATMIWSQDNGFTNVTRELPWDEISPHCHKEYTRDYVESPSQP